MGLIRRHPTATACSVLAVLVILAAHDGWRWWQLQRLNAAIVAGTVPPADAAAAPRELRFALAYQLAASGSVDGAITRYGTLQGDDALGRAARYNGANLLLRQGIGLRQANQPGQALALIELAKEQYREILRADPEDWSARYNLERAQRLVPEAEDADEAAPDSQRKAERAATTMRGYSPGLP